MSFHVVTVFLNCGHNYCSGCFLFTMVNYFPLDREIIQCRVCRVCGMFIRESSLKYIRIAKGDFLREATELCNIGRHERDEMSREMKSNGDRSTVGFEGLKSWKSNTPTSGNKEPLTGNEEEIYTDLTQPSYKLDRETKTTNDETSSCTNSPGTESAFKDVGKESGANPAWSKRTGGGTGDKYTEGVDIKGVRNLGMTCYANSIFQILGQTYNFKKSLTDSFMEALGKQVSLPLTVNLAAILEQLNGKGRSATVETEVNNFLLKMVSLNRGANYNNSDYDCDPLYRERSFGKYEMNDCCEFLMCVFEGLKAEDETATSMFENTIQTFFKFEPCTHEKLGEPQISHSLLIPLSKGRNTSYSVSAGLKEFLKTETFGKQELPCRVCNFPTETNITKHGLVLTKLPEILIIQIGRVKAKKFIDWSFAKKENDLVRYDEDLEVPQTTKVNGNVEEIIFSFILFGVVLHSGSIDTGHYYSYVKKLHTDKWFSCNDSSVRPMEKKYVFDNHNAYLLFYQKRHEVGASTRST